MILVDTSVWVQHLRTGVDELISELLEGRVLIHPLVVGELACGNLKNRREILDLLGNLPMAPSATNDEALAFLEARKLMGRGIGFVDVHLLASTALAPPARLWTRDRRLEAAAVSLGLARA